MVFYHQLVTLGQGGPAAVPAGETVTLSIVFSWHFPDRDYKASNDHSTDGLMASAGLW